MRRRVLHRRPDTAERLAVQPMQHHRAARQPGDDAQQFRRRRDGAADADAGGDDGILRRPRLPFRGLGVQREHASQPDVEQPLV